ncbi:hypothetical protein [uncultured Demequina sp.]|uniref:hypothetical protein n=1 Tax=uncultured Demequina sp. TaxID=693499 RepID=UPI0025D27FB9|nr:hypothetical protein [uncultured Demequina sp.]
MAEIPGSDQLHALALLALDHGIASAGHGPVIPFAVEEDSEGRRSLTRFPSGSLEEGIVHARGHVHASSAPRVVVCFDGYVAVEEGRFDAVWVMAHEVGMAASVSFFQRYRSADAAVEAVGNAGYAGEADPLLPVDPATRMPPG